MSHTIDTENQKEAIRPDGLDEKLALSSNVFDWRLIDHGIQLPTQSYADQPYFLRCNDGSLLCVVTTGQGEEGQRGQHVTVLSSSDDGLNWSDPMPIEPPNGPESSYAVLFKTSYGRIYCFYNFNKDNLRQIATELPGNPPTFRMDTLGAHVFRYSDDNGKSWSAQRYEVPIRESDIDRNNITRGKIRFFWNVGRPFTRGDCAYLSIHKVGNFGEGFLAESEGWLIRSSNLLHEKDPKKLCWETLPRGETGLKAIEGEGRIAEEQSYTVLSDGSIHVVYRTLGGYLTESYSRDGGESWTRPQHQCYANGKPMKNPRAAAFIWQLGNGFFLQWFHNHGGPFIRGTADGIETKSPYEDRNPVWISPGIEVKSANGNKIVWAQPEILLYHDDPRIRMSYPDLIETNRGVLISETQKHIARIHLVNDGFINRICSQFSADFKIRQKTLWSGGSGLHKAPLLPEFSQRDFLAPDHRSIDLRQGFSISCRFVAPSLDSNTIVIDAQTPSGKGWALTLNQNGTLLLTMNDGQTLSCHQSSKGLLGARGTTQHVVVVVDGGPKIVCFIINGIFDDGGRERQFGWSRFSPHLASANGNKNLSVADFVEQVDIHGSALLICEAVTYCKISKCDKQPLQPLASV